MLPSMHTTSIVEHLSLVKIHGLRFVLLRLELKVQKI
jgi:hypothetical protein